MSTAPPTSVPDRAPKGQRGREPMSKATKANVAALKRWRTNHTREAKAELAERTRQTQRARWTNMPERGRWRRARRVSGWPAAS